MIELAKLRAADFYCGGGGSTTGAENSGRVAVVYALNHWEIAIETHQANHPELKHRCAGLDRVVRKDDIRTHGLRGIDIFMASPECTHHSVALGGAPRCDQKRAGAREFSKWVRACKPKWLVVENVREFLGWGPLRQKRCKETGELLFITKGKDKGQPHMEADPAHKGEYFREWKAELEAMGYQLDIHFLNAADFGAATKRIRLFIIGRRGKGPMPKMIPTHAKNPQPGDGLLPWRPAHSIIDWTRPCPSIFSRPKNKPLVDKSLRRIEIGLRKIVEPFLVHYRGNSTTAAIGEPIPTITAGGGHFALLIPFGVAYHGGTDPKRDGSERAFPLFEPMGTLDTQPRYAVATPVIIDLAHSNDKDRSYPPEKPLPTLTTSHTHALAVPFITPHFGERDGQTPRTHDVKSPLPTVTSQGAGGIAMPFLFDSNHGEDGRSGARVYPLGDPLNTLTSKRGHSLALPFLTEYYGTGDGEPVTDPLNTITTHDRFGLATVYFDRLRESIPEEWKTPAMVSLLATMEELGIADIGYRMIVNEELSRATGFPEDYYWHGTGGEITKQIGNAVPPPLMEAICRAIGECE
jgi:DNA (cytosine-5)-methyltransferase 1